MDGEVRELIRRRGLDPFIDPGPVRALVRDVVADYAERSLSSALPPIGDAESVLRDVLDRVAGFGPLQRYLDDPEVEEIWVNEPGRVFVARRGRSRADHDDPGTGDELADLVERMLRTVRSPDRHVSTPFVDATLPDGSRLHVVIPDITRRHMAVNIRKFVLQAHTWTSWSRLGTLTAQAARFLEAAVAAGLNILVSGGTQAGKTTLLNCLCAAIPARERVITCEEVFELRVPLPDVVSMQTRQPNLEGTGEIPLRRLVKEALRMRPSRIIVGEVRQEECLDLLIALNSGLPGMCTLHANSAREAVVKMCTLPLLAGENIGARVRRPDRGRQRRPGRARGHRRAGASGGSARSSRSPAGPRAAVIETADVFTSRDGRLRPRPTATRRTPSGSPQPGLDLAALLGRTRAVTRCLRRSAGLRGASACSGVGLLLIWRSGPRAPQRTPAPPRLGDAAGTS